MIRTLLIDNYDSFTFDLYQLIAEVNGTPPQVVKNDQLFWDDLDHQSYDNIVVSPGPGSPDKPADFGICAYAVVRATCPVLGVCLGHQGMAHYHGGRVTHAPKPMHGRRSAVFHDGQGLFKGLPNPLNVVRYHSLMVSQLPSEFVRTAWTQDGLTMGLRHATRPLHGVQFHPESICTQGGKQLLSNFASITREFFGQSQIPGHENVLELSHKTSIIVPANVPQTTQPAMEVTARKLDFFCDPENTFVTLFGKTPHAYWLDSSRHESGLARFSYMGDASGPHSHVLRYWTDESRMSITRNGHETSTHESLLDHLDRDLKARAIAVRDDLPFEFTGGYVGYFGYELLNPANPIAPPSTVPDAIFTHADRFMVFDHRENNIWLVSCSPAADAAQVKTWMDCLEAQLKSLPAAPEAPICSPQEIELSLRHRPASYLAMIDRCQQLLKDGESYELCLTNQLAVKVNVDPLSYYRNLRRINPAPYAAYFNYPELSIASSSPECFLQINKDRTVESKPIKGTARRSADPVEDIHIKDALAVDEKTQAENLMIVDLLRNDLGQVCEVGTVRVPKLMNVETYATVHQMVSTIAGTLREDCSVIDCLKASFPGGSMTGAPKIRSMDALVGLEQGRRGIYSGAIGFLCYSGETKLNIVIRTAVIQPGLLTVGAGGAIVALSDRQEELEETFVKLEPPLKALAATIGTSLDEMMATHWEGAPMFTNRTPVAVQPESLKKLA